MKAAGHLLRHPSRDHAFLSALCSVPISSIESMLQVACCLPMCTVTDLSDFRILSYSVLYKCMRSRPIAYLVHDSAQVLVLGKGSVFSFPVLWSQHLSDPLVPLLLMTCQESFKGTRVKLWSLWHKYACCHIQATLLCDCQGNSEP